jgi:hypothetical protein
VHDRRRRVQPRERRLQLPVGDVERAAQHLPDGQRDLRPVRLRIAALAVGAVAWSASAIAYAQAPAAVTPPPLGTGATPAASAGANAAAHPAAPAAPAAPADAAAAGAPAAEHPGPIPIADQTAAASDHDAVVGHVGVEASRFDPGPLPLTLQPGVGCPAAGAGTPPCEVTMGALSARYWWTRNLAFNGGAVFAVGGGRAAMQGFDTHVGLGPIVGLTLLLGNWRHLAVSANPQLAYVWFRPGGTGGGADTTMVSLRAALEAEVHLGFIGVPALSVGLVAGMGFQYESAGDARLWSIGVLGGDSIWGALSNLFVRYYL